MRGNVNKGVMQPVCHICSQNYNVDLMYICYEACKEWFHADAVELDESMIFNVVGFRCCRCRRIKNTKCPYSVKKKPLEDKIERQRHATKPKISKMDLDCGLIPGSNGSNSIKTMQIMMRSLKKDTNSDGCSANYSFRIEISNTSETKAVTTSVQRIASKEKAPYCVASDDTQLERQTTVLSLERLGWWCVYGL